MSRASNRKGTQILSDKNINPLGQINTNKQKIPNKIISGEINIF